MIRRFFSDKRAATAIEYCLIAGLISIVIFAGAAALGARLNARFLTPTVAGLS